MQVINQRLLLLSCNPHLLPGGAASWCSHSVGILIRVVHHIRLAFKRRSSSHDLGFFFFYIKKGANPSLFPVLCTMILQLISQVNRASNTVSSVGGWGISKGWGREEGREAPEKAANVNKQLTQQGGLAEIGRKWHFDSVTATSITTVKRRQACCWSCLLVIAERSLLFRDCLRFKEWIQEDTFRQDVARSYYGHVRPQSSPVQSSPSVLSIVVY